MASKIHPAPYWSRDRPYHYQRQSHLDSDLGSISTSLFLRASIRNPLNPGEPPPLPRTSRPHQTDTTHMTWRGRSDTASERRCFVSPECHRIHIPSIQETGLRRGSSHVTKRPAWEEKLKIGDPSWRIPLQRNTARKSAPKDLSALVRYGTSLRLSFDTVLKNKAAEVYI